MSIQDLKVGDIVRVFDRSNRSGKPQYGTVSKVGTKLITVESKYGRETVFRKETGYLNSKDWGSSSWIKTLAQAAEDERRHYLETQIKSRGWQTVLYTGRSMSTQLLEEMHDLLLRHEQIKEQTND